MMNLLMIIFFLFYDLNMFSGVFLYLVMFIFLLGNISIFGMDIIKGDLFGVFGMDYISFYMILLLLWLGSLILILFYSWFLSMLILILMLSMILMFSSLDMLYLFIYFEFSMLPMFLIITFFGSFKERYMAGLYMFIYTMVSSLPMLVILLYVSKWLGSLSFDYIMFDCNEVDFWAKIIIMMMFLVKVPMFMVHIWLPKAHVEAPVYGSMILASVMLKMGGYGIIRCMDMMIIDNYINDFFFSFCLCGCLMISYMCLFYGDLKVLVAYSSVIHMGVMLMGFFSSSELGYLGGVLMMLSHGICSSGMFYLVNEIYKISGSRLVLLNKGSMSVMPVLIWMWFIMLINNLGVPPCFGILGELTLMIGCLGYFMYVFMFFIIIIFFVSCFVMNMFSLLVGGNYMFRFFNISLISYYGSLMHLIPLNFFIFFILICL